MRLKRILRFYFSADSLNFAMDRLIKRLAIRSQESLGSACAERMCDVIGEKSKLSKLWGYIDTVLDTLSGGERRVLQDYSKMRTGIKGLEDDRRREIRRVCMKFTRHARRLEYFAEGLSILGKYYCLITPS